MTQNLKPTSASMTERWHITEGDIRDLADNEARGIRCFNPHPLQDSMSGFLLHDYPDPQVPNFTPRPLTPILGQDQTQENVEKLETSGLAQRFNQPDYFQQRRATEEWLRSVGRASLGFALRCIQPVYFKLSRTPQWTRREGYNTLSIPAHYLDINQMTFTLHDSMHNYAQHSGQPYANTPPNLIPAVLPWNYIERLWATQKLDEYFTGAHGAPYVECQFWHVGHRLIDLLSRSS